MTQRESKLSNRIMTMLRKEGIFCFKVWGNDMMMAGLPDIIACVDGLFIGFETKMPESRNDVSPRQKYVHTMIYKAGGKVYVVCSVAETKAIVQKITLQNPPVSPL